MSKDMFIATLYKKIGFSNQIFCCWNIVLGHYLITDIKFIIHYRGQPGDHCEGLDDLMSPSKLSCGRNMQMEEHMESHRGAGEDMIINNHNLQAQASASTGYEQVDVNQLSPWSNQFYETGTCQIFLYSFLCIICNT